MNRSVIQGFISAAGTTNGGTAFVPAGTWYVDRPVHMDQSGVSLIGEAGSKIASTGPFSPVVIGCKRVTGSGIKLVPSDFIDLFGLLDTSIVSGPNQRWGYSLAGGKHLLFFASPISQGMRRNSSGGILDAYRATRTLTIEGATRITSAPWAVGPLMGLVNEPNTLAAPWCLAVVPSGGNFPTNSDGGPNLALTITTSEVTSVTVVSGGSGYTSAPTVTINDLTGYGSGATATATVVNGVVTAINVTNGGANYTAPAPQVTFSGGGGSGASAGGVLVGRTRSFYAPLPAAMPLGMLRYAVQVDLPHNVVAMWAGFGGARPTQLAVSTLGNGPNWGSLPNLAFLPNENSAFRVGAIGFSSRSIGTTFGGAASGGVSFPTAGIGSINVINGGSGYTSAPTVTINANPNCGSGATATATISGGIVTGVTVNSPGSGYLVQGGIYPTVALSGGGGAGAIASAIGGPFDRDVLALRVSAATRYVVGATGSALTRSADGLTGASLNDGKMYFNNEAYTLAYLPMDEGPRTPTPDPIVADRSTPIMCAGGTVAYATRGYGQFLDPSHGPIDWVSYPEIRDISVAGAQDYGCAIEIQEAINPCIGGRNITITGGAHAVAVVPAATNYFGQFWGNITVSSYDTSMYLWFGIWNQTGIIYDVGFGRWSLRVTGGGSIYLDKYYVAATPNGKEGAIRASGSLQANLIAADWEIGTDAYLKTMIYLENFNAAIPTPPIWTIVDVSGAVTSPTAPVFLLDDHGYNQSLGAPAAQFSLRSYTGFGDYPAGLIRVMGRAAATGRHVASQAFETPYIVNASPDGLSRIIVEHHQYQGVPTRTSWATQSQEIIQDNWVDGGYEKFLVAVGGAFNTPSPPTFLGAGTRDVTGSGLAAYLVGHAYATGGNTTPHQGGFSDFAQAQFLNGYFRGTNPTPPTLTWGLATQDRGARLDGTMNLLTGAGGYSAQPSPSWTASAGGATANTSALNFGSAITGTGTVNAVVGYAGGVPWVQIPIQPIALTSTPQAIGFAPGTLQIAAQPLPGNSVGSLATGVQDKLNNFVLGGAAIPSPGPIRVALSTSPASTSAPVEPVGNGYARVAIGAWTPVAATSVAMPPNGLVGGWTTNVAAATFPPATGAWGTIRSIYLMDSTGYPVGWCNLPNAKTPVAGSPALTVGSGAFWVSWS